MLEQTKDIMWWDMCKDKFKRLIIYHSIRISNNNKRILNENQLRDASKQLHNAEQIALLKTNVGHKPSRAQAQ